jgi:hypothetical protein
MVVSMKMEVLMSKKKVEKEKKKEEKKRKNTFLNFFPSHILELDEHK